MKILVDADACPVKEIIIEVAKELDIKIIMFIDTSHILKDGYAEVITVDKGFDSVDMALVNSANRGDVIVTQDYGLAAMGLSKHAYVINQNGLIFDNDNIDTLLNQRHFVKQCKNAGKRIKTGKKRTKEDDVMFEVRFRELLDKALE